MGSRPKPFNQRIFCQEPTHGDLPNSLPKSKWVLGRKKRHLTDRTAVAVATWHMYLPRTGEPNSAKQDKHEATSVHAGMQSTNCLGLSKHTLPCFAVCKAYTRQTHPQGNPYALALSGITNSAKPLVTNQSAMVWHLCKALFLTKYLYRMWYSGKLLSVGILHLFSVSPARKYMYI